LLSAGEKPHLPTAALLAAPSLKSRWSLELPVAKLDTRTAEKLARAESLGRLRQLKLSCPKLSEKGRRALEKRFGRAFQT